MIIQIWTGGKILQHKEGLTEIKKKKKIAYKAESRDNFLYLLWRRFWSTAGELSVDMDSL